MGEEKIQKYVIEGINANGDGGETIKGDLTPQEICDGINSLFRRYYTVAFVPSYPRGKTYKFTGEVLLVEIENIVN